MYLSKHILGRSRPNLRCPGPRLLPLQRAEDMWNLKNTSPCCNRFRIAAREQRQSKLPNSPPHVGMHLRPPARFVPISITAVALPQAGRHPAASMHAPTTITSQSRSANQPSTPQSAPHRVPLATYAPSASTWPPRPWLRGSSLPGRHLSIYTPPPLTCTSRIAHSTTS